MGNLRHIHFDARRPPSTPYGKMSLIASQYESDRSMYCRYMVQLVEYLGYEVIIKDRESGDYWRMIIDGERDQPRKK